MRAGWRRSGLGAPVALALLVPLMADLVEGQGRPSSPHVRGRLEALAPRGRAPTRVRVSLDVQAGWHIGGEGAGRFGVPTRIAWQLPNGWSVAGERWPDASRLVVAGDTIQALTGTVVIDAVLVRPRSSQPGPVRAVITYGACHDICVPGRLTLALDP